AEANRLIGNMPPKGLEFYQLQYGAQGMALLDEARRKSDPQLLAEVAQKYFHTDAGAEAANLLGTYHLDRGRPVMAALCFERLLGKSENEGKPSALTLLKAAVAFRRTGDAAGATQAWQRLTKLSPSGVEIGGHTVALDELKKELDRVPSEAVTLSQYDWPMAFGSASRSAHGKGGTPFLDEHSWDQPTIMQE